jgi:acetyltransferase-like isoleucine patch superfamily enzyme
MVSIIVFSKDRPLQLHGYLQSLEYFSGMKLKYVSVLFKDSPEIPYDMVRASFPDVHWVAEKSFLSDLFALLEQAEDYVMFGCDDVLFHRHFNINHAVSVLSSSPEVFGFSLRLGRNIRPNPAENDIEVKAQCIEWDWTSVKETHWSYPWELDATLYRKNDVVRVINIAKAETIANPNYLEAEIGNNPTKYIDKKKMACFNESKCIVITINRVQEFVKNGFDASRETSPKKLAEFYSKGYHLRFLGLGTSDVVHVGSSYFQLAKDPMKYSSPAANVRSRGRQSLAKYHLGHCRYLAKRLPPSIKISIKKAMNATEALFSFLSQPAYIIKNGGRIRGKANVIKNKSPRRKGVSRRLRVDILGQQNILEVSASARLEKSSIRIMGSRNKIVFHERSHGILSIEVYANDCTVEIGGDTGFTGSELRLWDSNSRIIFLGNTIVAKDTKFYVTDFHSVIDIDTGMAQNQGQYIQIGKHCWIGEGVRILKNVTVADDIIVAPSAVVTKDLDKSHSVYGGIPAVIKKSGITWDYKKYDDYHASKI